MRWNRREWMARSERTAASGSRRGRRYRPRSDGVSPSTSPSDETPVPLAGFEPRSMLRVPQKTAVERAMLSRNRLPHPRLTWSAVPLGPEPFRRTRRLSRITRESRSRSWTERTSRRWSISRAASAPVSNDDRRAASTEAHPGRFVSFTEPSWNAIEREDFASFQADRSA